MPDRQRPPARDAPHRHRDDTIVRLLALALAALTITSIPRILLADLLTVAAWLTLLASLLLTGLLLTSSARASEQHGPRDRTGPILAPTTDRTSGRDNEQKLEDNSFDFNA
jgi:hypothetical protein